MELASGFELYQKSIRDVDGAKVAVARTRDGKDVIYLSGDYPLGFSDCYNIAGGLICPFTYANVRILMGMLPSLKAIPLGDRGMSFGFGDRLGMATPGHVRAVVGSGFFPVFAQQSIREMQRTRRTPQDVMLSTVKGMLKEGYNAKFGADADHLKRLEDVDYVLPYGYSMFTCDPSDYVNNGTAFMSVERLKKEFDKLPDCKSILDRYNGKRFNLRNCVVEFDEMDVMKAAVKYYRAVEFAARMFSKIKGSVRGSFDFELSVDETDEPTSYKEHVFIVNELRRLGVEFTGIALRFVGEFHKGVDYIGDLSEFEESVKIHRAILDEFGPYRISVHSGSDKLSIYPILGKYFEGFLHVKTAGTSYLEALKVVAKRSPSLFAEVYNYSLQRFDEDKKSYYIDVDKSHLPSIDAIDTRNYPDLLQDNDVRQMLHVTYGSVLTSPLKDDVLSLLVGFEDDYYVLLEKHFRRHIDALKGGV